MMKCVIKSIWIAALLMLAGCQNNPFEIQKGGTGDISLRGTKIISDTLYAIESAAVQLDPVSTVNNNRLLVGAENGYAFRPILKFPERIPDVITAQNIDKAYIRFQSVDVTTKTASRRMSVSAFPITKSWDGNLHEIWKAPFRNNINSTRLLAEMTTASRKDSLEENILTFTAAGKTALLDLNITQLDEYGLLLDFSGVTFIKEFWGNGIEDRGPELVVTYVAGGSDTLTYRKKASLTAFLVDGNLAAANGYIYTATLSPWAAGLRFDLAPLRKKYPQGILFAGANLEMVLDVRRSLPYQVLNTDHETWGTDLFMVALDSDSSAGSLTLKDAVKRGKFDSRRLNIKYGHLSRDAAQIQDTARMDIHTSDIWRNYFRKWYIQEAYNDSNQNLLELYIAFSVQNQYLGNFGFFDHQAANPEQRPRLIVQYIRLPKDRF